MITALDKNTALVLIDLQNSIVGLPLAHPVDEILTNVNKLIAAFRKKNLPIVVVNVNPAGALWTKSRKEAKPTPLPDNNSWHNITDKIDVDKNDVYITKQFRFFDSLGSPYAIIYISSRLIVIEQVHRYLHELRGGAPMQEKNFVIIIKIHQFSDQTSCLIHYFLE